MFIVQETKPETTMVEICEGSAKILSENRVFYNPVQQFNRDLSILVLSSFWQLCQEENEERNKTGKKVPGSDFSVSIDNYNNIRSIDLYQ